MRQTDINKEPKKFDNDKLVDIVVESCKNTRKINKIYVKFIKIHFFFCVSIIFIFSDNLLFAQNDTLIFKNKLNFELGGHAGHYSINFEKRLFKKKNNYLSGTIGFSPSLFTGTSEIYSRFSPRIYFQLKENIKFKKNYFEFGTALTIYYWSSKPFSLHINNTRMALFPILGYSRVISEKFNLGVYFTPLVYDHNIDFIPHGAVQLGYRLK